MMTIGFAGGGRVTRIMLRGWREAGVLPARVLVCDTDAAVLERLAREFAEVQVRADAAAVAAEADIVFLALHPPALGPALPALQAALRPATVVVSLAPKYTLAEISAALGGHAQVARVLPNAPSAVCAGYNPFTAAAGLTASARAALLALLEPLGECPEVAEWTIEAYAITAAMGPTYLWFQLEHLAALGVEFGLDPADARRAVAAMTLGALRTLYDADLSPAEVLDLIPVRPLAQDEDAIRELYTSRLRPLYERIRSTALTA